MKNFLSLKDYKQDEVLEILSIADELKSHLKNNVDAKPLNGKSLAMLFQKPSNRTRISFEVGMYQLGGHAVNVRPEEIGMGEREEVKDVARVISRYTDIVMIRATKHKDVEEFANYSRVPVINGLSELYHPCQALADVLTIKERFNTFKDLKLCYIGDGNNVCNSLVNICQLLEIEVTVCCPKGYEPTTENLLRACKIDENPESAISDSNIIYTDVWASMGQENEQEQRTKDFRNYKVSKDLLKNMAKEHIFMHCLPAHRGQEVDDEVFEGKNSLVFEQAENRLHAQKALMVYLLR